MAFHHAHSARATHTGSKPARNPWCAFVSGQKETATSAALSSAVTRGRGRGSDAAKRYWDGMARAPESAPGRRIAQAIGPKRAMATAMP